MKHFYFLTTFFFLFTTPLHAQIVFIPDPIFKAMLLEASPTNHVGSTVNPNSSATSGVFTTIDTNGDGEIQVSEAEVIIYLRISGSFNNLITNLQGIEAFTNLQSFICSNNNTTSVDLSNNINLNYVFCSGSNISSINLNGCVNLTILNLSNNELTTIDLSSCSSLRSLIVNNNHLTSLDLGSNQQINDIEVSHNNLTTFSLANKPLLQTLYFGSNQITTLALYNLPILYRINGLFNNISQLDLSTVATQPEPNNQSLTNIFNANFVGNPNLSVINLKNGYANPEVTFNFSNTTNIIQHICIDSNDVISSYLANSQVNFSDYCSFTPGGNYNTITGTLAYDSNNNGCDASDNLQPNIRVNINDGINTGDSFTSNSGNYAFYTQAGSFAITPNIENPTWFNFSPSMATITFGNNNNNTTAQNFCITANANHSDLEITLLPFGGARPGFNSTYKIIYKNKGTLTQSGTISLSFNGTILHLVNTNPAVSSQTVGSMNWGFTNLQPFESRQILVTLNVNAPFDAPPVFGGDILNFTADINSSLTDEIPDDNSFTLHQTVVNSFDPNDKTCLEGNTITPEMVGKEVHYLIRFENTGTANAENIVVKDMINTAKFDIASLIPIDGSHPFVTKISNTNKVEFIFENINLPFDDENNDGYVAFKIKTKPTLVLGDTFSNTASIYFDYNFPIITNNATTTVAVLANQDFAFENYINVYPNPAHAVLNIDLKKEIAITSFYVYNTLGQLVLVIPNAQQVETIDVSSLKTGNYFLKVNSDQGSSNMKFIKQ